ncbi:MAG: hypothetical protein ABIW76_17740 [Fibrobacteria bacterium]
MKIDIAVLALIFSALFIFGCKEEAPVIYSERIAILPDRSGLLIKEVRVLDKTRNEMIIKRTAGGTVQELFLVSLADFDDVKFKFRIGGDTIYLVHAQPGLEKALHVLNPSATPIRYETVSPAQWLSVGTLEGDPIFYAEEKWGAFFDLMREH